jgi:hypothetical protein
MAERTRKERIREIEDRLEGWKIKSRRLRPLDGTTEARDILLGTFAAD